MPKYLLRSLTLGAAVAALTLSPALGADQPSAAELRLREQLRTTALQLRTMQSERDTLQAAKTQADLETKTLTEKLETLTKQTATEMDAAQKKIDGLSDRLADHETQINRLNESLEKWKTAYNEAAELARTKEGERAKATMKGIELQRIVDDQRRKNREMYNIGNEILTRYERFGLGTALTAREPFVGITRVKLQNLVQDYGEKLADQRIKPEEAAPQKPPAR